MYTITRGPSKLATQRRTGKGEAKWEAASLWWEQARQRGAPVSVQRGQEDLLPLPRCCSSELSPRPARLRALLKHHVAFGRESPVPCCLPL
uniref:Uncharacterized protein n=1 Tax=Gopherus evgoodei TaxID=1825980 RepID=A0A8C4VUN6_9SAUR